MYNLARRLLQAGAIVLWLLLVAKLWQSSLPFAIALLGIGVTVLVVVLRRCNVQAEHSANVEIDGEQAARYLVTKLLGDLTRVQVAYLSQQFESEAQARRWLKRALPRGYRGALPQLHADLLSTSGGDPPESVRLAMRVLEMRRQLDPVDAALEAAHAAWPNHAVARPVAFVITESIDLDDENSEPLVVSAAGWDPSKPTLLPRVDVVTLFTEENSHKQVHGQIDFDTMAQQLQTQLERVENDEHSAVAIYATKVLGAPGDLGLSLSRLPVGFVVGASEFL